MGRRTETLLVAFLRWAGRTGEEAERDWALAVLAEAAAVPVDRRRGWLVGGAWFVVRRRRPASAQVISAWAGLLFALMLCFVGRSDLVEDAPDMPRAAAAMMLVGAVVLALTFLVVSFRPLAGLLAAVAGLPLYAVLVMAARQVSVASFVSAPPPPGMAPLDGPPGGVPGFALALVILVGVPLLALLGALLLAVVGGGAGRGGAGGGPGRTRSDATTS